MKYLDKFYEEWYLDYASYVILERAVPKLEDGLKPVQRRILHSMFEMHDNRFHKVANIIGHSMKYHPHGDASIGDALVNLTHRSMLIETQGNFGDVRTGDKAAAPRYIEAKLSNFAVDISINKRLTAFQDSYDGRNKEPVALSMKFPILLLNGVDGIAVGLSTKILPHNFQELLKASIAILNEKTYRIVPDFENGGFIDVDDYKMGKKGGKVRLRSEIEISSKDQIIIKSVPYTVTTGSLIDSILKANENGKIKIKNIEDNTAEDVNITINLPKGISPNKTIDGLYLFTQCEISISPNCCIIKNNKPVFTNVNEVLSDSVYQTRNLLKSELELEKSDLEHKWHLLSLEKIFIENKIYRMIEDATEWEEVIDIIKTALKPFIAKLKKPLTQDDIIHLTELKIKKISKYDIDKTKDKLIYLNNNIDEVTNHIVHIKEYTIRFFEKILEKYGTDKSRKTKIEKFDTIKVKQAALTNKKLYIDYEQGFCGFSLKDKELLCECSEFDDIIIFLKDGSYIVTKVDEKKFVGKDIVYAGLWKKKDRHMIYNLVYLNESDKKSYIKRFSIESIVRDKIYPVAKNIEKSKILYITGNPNSESEIIKVNLHFKAKAKKKEFEYDFSEVIIKNRLSKGNILTKYPIRKITQSEIGSSTFGGKKVWFDKDIGKLNYDERGDLIGRFEADNQLLIIYKSGQYELTNIDLNRRFNLTDIEIFKKFSSDDLITCLHYIGSKKSYYLKRFKIETNLVDRMFSFIDDSRGSKFIKGTVNQNPTLNFSYRTKSGEKKEKLILVKEFIDIKGWKASGNKLPSLLRMSSFKFIDGVNDNLNDLVDKNETEDANEVSKNDNFNEDLTLF